MSVADALVGSAIPRAGVTEVARTPRNGAIPASSDLRHSTSDQGACRYPGCRAVTTVGRCVTCDERVCRAHLRYHGGFVVIDGNAHA